MTYPTIRPSLTLDFQNSQQLDPRIMFSRPQTTGQATYINSAGMVAYAAEHEARFEEGGLLIEESRTNYIQNSTDFNAGDWAFKAGGTALGIPVCTTNFAVAPDGTNTATRLVCDHGGGTTNLDQSYLRCNRDSNTRAVSSIWIKSNTGSDQTIYMTTQTQPVIATNTWTRWYGLSNDFRIGARGDFSDQNIDILIWGAQVEDGDMATGFSTSYIPTAGSTMNRAKDLAIADISLSATQFSQELNYDCPNSQGTKYAVYLDNNGSQTKAALTVSNNNDPSLRKASHWSDTRYNGQGGFPTAYLNNIEPENYKNIGSIWDSTTGLVTASDGVQIEDNSNQSPNLIGSNGQPFTRVAFGFDGFTGHIARYAFYSELITNEQLEAITL